MLKTAKKAISILLAAIMLVSMAVPSFAANYDEKPTIYVTGARVTHIYNADGSLLFPNNSDAGTLIKEKFVPCLKKFAVGMVTDDYEKWTQELRDIFVEILGDMALDKDGNVSDGSYPEHPYNYTLPAKTSGYGSSEYRLWYDWRISPLETAELLKMYIEDVKRVTGEDKVNITGRCYGANVVQAYLTLYPEHALQHVDDVAYLSSSVDGIDALGALFTGDIEFEDQAVNNFVDYYMENEDLVENEEAKALILATVEMLNYISVLGLTGDALELLVQDFRADVFPPILRDTFAGWPSYWAMLPAEKYDEAIDFIFADCKDEYAGFISKCDEYYNKVQLRRVETLKFLEEMGIDFYMISKYNFPDFPVYEGATALSDGNTTVYRQSFGATCADHGEILSDKYVKSLADKRYLSPDRKIDASTCLFPETSYFIKNLHHETFPAAINDLAANVMNHEATVSGGEYAQYLLFNGTAKLDVIEGLDEDGTKEKTPVQLIFIRFFTALLKILTRIFNRELDLGGVLGGLTD